VIVVTDATKVGEIAGHAVYRVVATDVVPIGSTRQTLTARQAEDDRTYVQMLKEVTNAGAFHFSHTFNLTRSLQSQATRAAALADQPLYKQVRFYCAFSVGYNRQAG